MTATPETSLTPAELSADQSAEAAMKAHHDFLLTHWEYFTWRGRTDPITGRQVLAENPVLDREAHRLHASAAAANRHAAEIEYEANHPDDHTTRRERCRA